jgi:tetratricopeptide (TPR) repeat protein
MNLQLLCAGSLHWFGGVAAGWATIVLTLILAVTLFFALRPPYSVRQLQLGIAYSDKGKYTLAVDCLSNSIRTDPNSSEALFARGRAYQQLGEYHTAYRDYDLSCQLTPTPIVNACRGYCLSRLASHKAAIAAYQLALEGGYKSPALLYNNIGFSYLMLRQLDDAEKYVQRAIRTDGNLQAPRHNMVLIFLRRTLQGQPIPSAAFVDATRAIEIGPCTPDLYRVVAALYARAAMRDPALIQPAIECVGKAVKLGSSPEAFASDPSYSTLQQEPAFHNALKMHVAESNSPRAIQLLDPLAKP